LTFPGAALLFICSAPPVGAAKSGIRFAERTNSHVAGARVLTEQGTSGCFKRLFSMPSGVQCNVSATWIVVPAYNEETVIAGVFADLQSLIHQVVVIDDGSDDATANVAVAAGGRIVVLKHPINLGQGAAVQTGITFALSRGAKFIVTFDADAQQCRGFA
jgi:Glycosyl transferase family 2